MEDKVVLPKEKSIKQYNFGQCYGEHNLITPHTGVILTSSWYNYIPTPNNNWNLKWDGR